MSRRGPRMEFFAPLALFALALSLASCAKPPAELSAPDSAAKPQAEVMISAAASTKDVLEVLLKEFESGAKVEVKINAGPSNGLANQILNGAPADLFLSASEQWAQEVEKGGQAESQVRLLTNKLVLVVPKDNP